MKKSIASLAASACFAALLGTAAPASAAFVTFVSEAGDNGNNCTSIATACREIAGAGGALDKTDSGGVIHVAPGEYSAFVVTKSLDIIVDGGEATIANSSVLADNAGVAGDAGIVVAIGAGDVVRLRGFFINSDHGIAIGDVGGVVHVEDGAFIGFPNRYGIIYSPTGASELYIKNSTFARENGATGGGGILIKPLGSGSARVVLDNVSVDDNSSGITIDGRSTTGTNAMTVRNSTGSGSTAFGLNAIDSGGGATNVMIEGSTFSSNGSQGVISNGANTTVHMRNSTVTGNARGIIFTASGKLISGGGNLVTGNTVDGVFSSTIAQK